METFYIYFLFSIELIYGEWMPNLSFSPNFDQFQKSDSKNLENQLYTSIDKNMPINFEWQSVASVSLEMNKKSFIIYGGSEMTKANSNSALPKNFSLVVICELLFNERNWNPEIVQCNKADTGDYNQYLGASIQALSLSDSEAVLVYCDPLWHVANISEPKPSGKCYLNFLKDGKIDKNTSIEFCRLSSKSFLSCLGGFSIDLISTNTFLSGIQMAVGMPYLHPYGSVKIVKDPFGSLTIIDPRNGEGKYFNFGYAVSIMSMSIAYASSPLGDHYGPSVTSLHQEIILTSPNNETFNSFGVSLKTLNIDNGRSHAVIIGAPFNSLKEVSNIGKTYIFCISNDNNNVKLSAQLYGKEKGEFYGYALANIGDINGDGNDDLAISSPFLDENDARGFVSIYTIGQNCEVNRKPQQILKSSTPLKTGIFGLAIAGGSDLDFNSWPDLVILSSRSNSIEIYASRTKYKAQCKFSFNNNFETEPLKNNQNVGVRVYFSLLDIKKGSAVNLNFLKTFNVISQIDPNYNTTEKRLVLEESKTSLSSFLDSILVSFFLKSLMHVKDMNLSKPLIIAYRLVEDCSVKECKDFLFPLINWEDCKTVISIKKFICNVIPTCNADLSLNITDLQGTEITYGYDKNYFRSIKLAIMNAGPTEGKDINFKVKTYQNLRIHKIKPLRGFVMKETFKENQMEAICRLDEVEIEINSRPIIIMIDIYFVDFKDPQKMKYMNSSVFVELFSDVKDSNITNNKAQIDYTFIYEPNLLYYGSPSKETVIDSRNRSQLIRHGQRLSIDRIGPRLSQRYVLENVGNATITNMIVTITIPIRTKDKFNILYFFERIKRIKKLEAFWMKINPQIVVGENRYSCHLPDKYINPLNIIGFETHKAHLRNIDNSFAKDLIHVIKRRSVNSSASAPISNLDNVQMKQGKMYRIPVEIVQCGRPGVTFKAPLCTEMQCKIPLLPPNKQARLQINAWLWAHTFFKKQISDIMIYTSLRTEFVEIPEGVKLKLKKSQSYSQSQHFIFKNVKPKIIHFKPWWPIIMGITIGILILAILIVAMYKCGFFRRKKIERNRKRENIKRRPHNLVIVHPNDMPNSPSPIFETRFTSHSTLIN